MLARRLLGLGLVCALFAGLATTPVASATPVAGRAASIAGAPAASALGSLRGRGFGGGFRARSPRPYGYGRSRARRHGGSFFRGVFLGWLLSHLFRGAVPLFPLLVFAFLLLALRRRRLRGPRGLRLR